MQKEFMSLTIKSMKANKHIFYFLVFLSLSVWFFLPIKYLIHFTSDDSYFYLKTAWNFSKGMGSTFDGINLTNGYHPLWFLVLSAYYSILNLFGNLSPELILKFTFLITAFINLISIYLIYSILKKIDFVKPTTSIFIFYLLIIPFTLFYLIGLETQIFLVIYLSLIFLLYKDEENNKRSDLLVGILCGLLFLSRIDFGLLLSASFIIRDLIRTKFRQNFLSLIIFLSFVLIYLIINKIYFGTFSSISSYYKFSFDVKSNLKFLPLPFSNPIDFSMLFIFIVSGIIYWSFKSKVIDRKSEIIKVFEISYIVSLLFLLIQIFLNRQGLREWYYSFPIFIAFTLLVTVIDRKRILDLFVFLSTLMFVVYFTIFRMNYYNHDSAYEFSKKVNALVKKDETIFQIDYSGLISFFSDRKIVNGDGLINSYDYYELLKQGRLFNYLDELNPEYFIFYTFDKSQKNVRYEFISFHRYLFEFEKDRIVLEYPLVYGGILRKKYGYFYLVKYKK